MEKDRGQLPIHDRGDLPQNLIQYWQNQAETVLARHSRNFNEFTRNCRGLVRRGDRELKAFNATGYNIVLHPEEVPFTSNEKLIFYNNYIRRTKHFGKLLAEMEYERIITPDQVNFGAKGSKVLYVEWGINLLDEQISAIKRKATTQGVEPIDIDDAVSKTVETVVVLKPQQKPESGLSEDDNAVQIAEFLLRRCNNLPGAIEGSWDIPDIRATYALTEAFESVEELVVVKLNIFTQKEGTAQLIIGRQRTSFGQNRRDWITKENYMNEDLQIYLASPELGVAP